MVVVQRADRLLRLGSWCLKHEISMIYRHTSGHADPALLRRYARALNPDKLVPIQQPSQ
jgi:hypothetical protein